MGLPSRSTIKSPKNVSPSGNRRLQRIFSCILKDLNLHIISFLFPTKKNKSRQMESGRFAFHGLRLFSILSRPKTVWKTWGKPCSPLQYSTLSVRYYMGRHAARIFLAPSYDCCYDNLNEIHKMGQQGSARYMSWSWGTFSIRTSSFKDNGFNVWKIARFSEDGASFWCCCCFGVRWGGKPNADSRTALQCTFGTS